MKKTSAVLVAVTMLTAVAQGGVYILADDVMEHMFWVNTDHAYRYGNQLLLLATITDYRGNIITTDAMVTYDTRWGNINLMHYGNYCIFSANWPHETGPSLIAQTGVSSYNVTWLEDYVYQATAPTISFDKKLPQFAGKQGLAPASGADSRKDDVINVAERATDPAASTSATRYLTSGFGHRYYLYDLYRIGDLNFNFYVCTMIAQSDYGPADGLLFLREIGGEYNEFYLVIITVFETDWMYGYSMAGLYDPWDSSYRGHAFALIGHGNEGSFTTLY